MKRVFEEVCNFNADELNNVKSVNYRIKNRNARFVVSILYMFNRKYVEKVLGEKAKVVGYITINGNSKENTAIGYFQDKVTKKFAPVQNKKHKGDVVKGYIKVGENEFVALTRDRKFWFIFLILLLCLFGCYVGGATLKDNSINISDTSVPEKNVASDTIEFNGNPNKGNVSLETESITFAGYSEIYANSSSPEIYLVNPEVNDVYFTYTIYDTNSGEIILDETDLIEPGRAYIWEPKNTLVKGDYNVYFIVNTFEMDTSLTACTPGRITNVKLHIYE